ncbi:MAG: hypothetical protein WBA47_09040 [Rhodanobacter sp.]
MMSARTKTSKAVPSTFFEKLRSLAQGDDLRFARLPIGHDYLVQLLPGEALPIDLEIRWIAARLSFEQKALNAYLLRANEVRHLFARGNYEKCLEELQACEVQLGISLWSTELRVGVTQAAHGIDAQKQVLKEIRSLRKRGIWPYIANAASVRAEPTVSISWFLEEARRRQDRTASTDTADYLQYRGSGEWPDSNAACARILRIEQNHHVIDVYETFVSYLQEASTRKPNERISEAISSALDGMIDIPDVRLRKIRFAMIGALDQEIPVHNLDLTDAALTGAPPETQSRLIRRNFRQEMTVERLFAMSLTTARTSLRREESASEKMIAVRGLSETLSRRGYQATTAGRADEKLKKFAHVFAALPIGKALRCIIDASVAPHTDVAARKLKLAALNSSCWGALDLFGYSDSHPYSALREIVSDGATVAFADRLAGATSKANQAEMQEGAAALADAIHLFRAARSDAAAIAVGDALSSKNRIVAAQGATIALNAYARTGDIVSASKLIAREHVDRGVDPDAMPVREIYQDLEWAGMEAAAAGPELSIALSLIQSTEGDDRIKTYRRFALETLLDGFGVTKPSELRRVETHWSQSLLVFLLDKVCTSAMLDMLPAIRSSREVLEERREICGYLAVLDKGETEKHRQEVLEISRTLTLLDGLQTIDGSRVHVDMESLSRRLKPDLAESFQRYTSLQKNADGQMEGLLTILKDVEKRKQQGDYTLALAASETDELLVSMIVRSRDRFLFDVPHGLDSYISKRIRHGSIVGVVRAPAERERVIAKRNLNGSYRAGDTWADSVADNAQRFALNAAIMGTSKAIDQHLIRLKDILLHVRSESKPYGLFDAPLNAANYLIIRKFASEDISLDGFVDTMFTSLWAMLTPSLGQAQKLLRQDSVAFVSEQFQSLRVKAQKIIKNPDERAAFDAAAVKASVGMQAALETAASWFEPAERSPRTYSLDEAVGIAAESVRATTTGFSPNIKLSGNSEFSFSDLALPLVCDVFYIALGNVAAHGLMEKESEIRVKVDLEDDKPYLLFTIENNVNLDNSELAELQSKLESIKKDIAASQGISRARSEGGSGLYKLASIVSEVDGDSLDFSCTNNHFSLHVRLSYSPDVPY